MGNCVGPKPKDSKGTKSSLKDVPVPQGSITSQHHQNNSKFNDHVSPPNEPQTNYLLSKTPEKISTPPASHLRSEVKPAEVVSYEMENNRDSIFGARNYEQEEVVFVPLEISALKESESRLSRKVDNGVDISNRVESRASEGLQGLEKAVDSKVQVVSSSMSHSFKAPVVVSTKKPNLAWVSNIEDENFHVSHQLAMIPSIEIKIC